MHILLSIIVILTAAVSATAQVFLSFDRDTDELVAVDFSTGAVQVLGAPGVDLENTEIEVVGGLLYVTNSIFGDHCDFLIIDPANAQLLSSKRVQWNARDIHVEGFTIDQNGVLYVGYSDDPNQSYSKNLGTLALDGTITQVADYSTLDPNADFDALGHTAIQGLFSADSRPSAGQSHLFHLDTTPPGLDSRGIIHGTPHEIRSNDLVFLGERLYGVDHLAYRLYEIDPTNAAILHEVLVAGDRSLHGLALQPAPPSPALYSIADGELLKIDSITGDVSSVGLLGRAVNNTDLAFSKGVLYCTNAFFQDTIFSELLAIDPTDARVLSVVPLRKDGTDLHVESVAVANDRLLVGFDANFDTFSNELGMLAADGSVSSMFDYSSFYETADMDGLAYSASRGLYSSDSRFPTRSTASIFSIDVAPPSFEFLGTIFHPTREVGQNDLVFLDDRLYGIDHKTKAIMYLDPNDATLLNTVPLVPPRAGLGLAAGRVLDLEPPSPGLPGVDNTLVAKDATAGTAVIFAGSLTAGSSPVGSCAPLVVNMAAPIILGSAVADGSGTATLVVFVPPSLSGQIAYVQALEAATCVKSPVVAHPFH